MLETRPAISKILIVDDHREMRQMTEFFLRDLAIDFEECADGADALDCYEKSNPEWVLTDWEMKRMNGIEATRQIHRQTSAGEDFVCYAARRRAMANKIAVLRNTLVFARLKHTSRQLLSAFFIYALVFLPLVSPGGAVREAQAQIRLCGNYTDQIFQNCPLDGSPLETALTNQAIDDVLALYELSASDRPLLVKHARSFTCGFCSLSTSKIRPLMNKRRLPDLHSTSSTPTAAATDSNSMNYTPWSSQSTTENNEARLSSRNWFLVRNNSNSQTTYRKWLSINYQGENGELLTARRRGREFVVTSPGNPNATVVADTIKTCVNNTVYTYKVKPNAALLAVVGNNRLNIGCGFRDFNPDTNESFFPVFLGRILDTGGTTAKSTDSAG